MIYRLYLIGEINEELYASFTKELAEIENVAKKTDLVEIELSSGGGTGYDALAFFDRIKNSPLTINITAIGYVASAAVLVLAAGDRRRITRNAWVMVHEDTVVDMKGKQVHEVEKDVAHYRRLEQQWCRLLGEITKTCAEQWEYLHLNETFLTSQDCLDYGLVKEII